MSPPLGWRLLWAGAGSFPHAGGSLGARWSLLLSFSLRILPGDLPQCILEIWGQSSCLLKKMSSTNWIKGQGLKLNKEGILLFFNFP